MVARIPKSKLGDMRFAKGEEKWESNYREYTLSPEELAEIHRKYGTPKKDEPVKHAEKPHKKPFKAPRPKEAGICKNEGCNHPRMKNRTICNECYNKIYQNKKATCLDCGAEIAYSSIRCIPCNNKIVRSKIDYSKPRERTAKTSCKVEGCDRGDKGNIRKGFCPMHYNRFKRHGDPLAKQAPEKKNEFQGCTICGDKHYALGYCNKHWKRSKKNGSPYFVLMQIKKNVWKLIDERTGEEV